MNKTFCPECRKEVSYKIKDVVTTTTLKGREYSYNEKQAFCNICNTELCVDRLEEENLKRLYDEYRIVNGIIEIEKIREISYRYKIGKRALSLLLGWGENTYSRYYDGDLPSKQYSDVLLRLYNEPEYFINILKKNKGILTNEQNYEKSMTAAKEYILHNIEKIDNVATYILAKCEDITQLALQKMLYYVQAFFYIFNGKFMFDDDCEAWVHGPVYSKIYKKYNNYFYSKQIVFDASVFTEEEKLVIDSVIANLGCYSGKVLEQFTHNERPLVETRNGLEDNDVENRIIDKKLIIKYFNEVKGKYNMLHPADIADYSRDMFGKLIM